MMGLERRIRKHAGGCVFIMIRTTWQKILYRSAPLLFDKSEFVTLPGIRYGQPQCHLQYEYDFGRFRCCRNRKHSFHQRIYFQDLFQ